MISGLAKPSVEDPPPSRVARVLHGKELQDGTGVMGPDSWCCCHSGLISENPELALKETGPVMTDVVA